MHIYRWQTKHTFSCIIPLSGFPPYRENLKEYVIQGSLFSRCHLQYKITYMFVISIISTLWFKVKLTWNLIAFTWKIHRILFHQRSGNPEIQNGLNSLGIFMLQLNYYECVNLDNLLTFKCFNLDCVINFRCEPTMST